MSALLSGLKVVECGDFISAPYCAKLMADLGADVIKVETPNGGDLSRTYGPFPNDSPHPECSGLYLYNNTSKLGVTLNIVSKTGTRLLKELLREADVFVENNPPRLMHDLGFGYETLKDEFPRLVMTSITPYGQTGPYRDYKAHHINCCALGGVSQITGHHWREPLTMPAFQGHYQAAVVAAGATMTALLARQVTGRGQLVDVSEAEVWGTYHVGFGVTKYTGGAGDDLCRGYLGGGMTYPAGRLIPCKDGYIAMVAPQLKQWITFLELMGKPDWTENPRYRDRHAMQDEYPEEVDALLTPWFLDRTRQEIFDLCEKNAVPFAPLYTMQDEANEPHLKAREFFTTLNRKESGEATYPGPAYKLSDSPWSLARPAPLLGEHNEDIFCSRLGYTREDLVVLKQSGVV